MNLSRAVALLLILNHPRVVPYLYRMQSPQFRAFVVAEEGELSVPATAGIVKGQGIRNLRLFVSVWEPEHISTLTCRSS